MRHRTSFPLQFLVLWLIVALATPAVAQDHIQTTSFTDRPQTPNGLSRDFWFAMVKNYEQEGRYYEMYVAAYATTTVNIALGTSAGQQFPVEANKVLVFRLPLDWEMSASGIIQQGVHVWSDDAELNVQALSRSSSTSDGMTVVPTVAWGNEYVVAAYHSFALLAGYEYPSEFAIVANQDETVVTITPSTDLRQGASTEVAYERGKPFTVTLDRGEAVQYQTSAANGNMEGYDVSGTTISSSKPVGVVGGVQCANVPVNVSYCDHLCEMLLPVDRWGKTYYSVPFAQRKGGDGFLVLAAQDNTTIYREDAQGKRVHAVVNKYEPFYRHDIDLAAVWTSDKPFLLAQYINSTDWPEQGANQGLGDPSMTIVLPVEQFTTEMIVQTPSITSGSFVNHLTIIAPKGEAVLLDGKSPGVSPLAIDGRYVAYRVPNVVPGSHTISSDSAIGACVYGYGSFDSYAWPGSLGSFTTGSMDTSAPAITSLVQNCFDAAVRIADPLLNRSAQIEIEPTITTNAEISQIEYRGAAKDSGSYFIRVLDHTKPAEVRVAVTDAAGNRRTITHIYEPNMPVPGLVSYSYRAHYSEDTTVTIDLFNNNNRSTGAITASLKRGTAFTIASVPDEIEAHDDDDVALNFKTNADEFLPDTIIVTDGCWFVSVPITSSTYGYELSDQVLDFGTVQVDSQRTRILTLTNRGSEPLTISGVLVAADPVFLANVTQTFPHTLERGESITIVVTMTARAEVSYSGTIRFTTTQGVFDVELKGRGSYTASVNESEQLRSGLSISPNPASSSVLLRIDLEDIAPTVSIVVFDPNGRQVLEQTELNSARTFETQLSLVSLPTGNYFVQVTANGKQARGKLTIDR